MAVRVGLLIAAGLGTLAAVTGFTSAAPEQTKLTADDAARGGQFGLSVSLDDDTALVGAINFFDGRGAVYVFRMNDTGWSQTAKLTAGDGEGGDGFGNSVALDGDIALVGAPLDDDLGTRSGSVYVFTRDAFGWSQSAKLIPEDGDAYSLFGASVSLDGNTALIGASTDDPFRYASGSAYVFTKDEWGWSQVAKLRAEDASAGDQFGLAVSLDGDTALVSAVNDDDLGTASGSAYIFTKDSTGNWLQTVKLTANDGAAKDLFGRSLALDGEEALIGAAHGGDSGIKSGAAYVFTRTAKGWVQTAKLIASDAAEEDGFGVSVSLYRGMALVGAPNDDDAGTFSGSAYLFARGSGGWSQVAKLAAADGAAEDLFGIAASLGRHSAIVGAHFDDDAGPESGSAYVFDLPLTAQDLTVSLIEKVMRLKLRRGLERALVVRLVVALYVLQDGDERNDVFAVWALRSFIRVVEVRRLKRSANADELIADARRIIEVIGPP